MFFTSAKAQCPNNNTLGGDLTPLTTGNTQQTNSALAGQYFTVQVCNGTNYTFTTCGDNDFDTQLTLYAATGGTALAYNDDGGCGVQSLINWTANFTGTVWILLDQYFCTNVSGAGMTLRVTQNTACTDFPPCNGICPAGGTPPAEDECFTALDLGQMPFPAPCTGTSGGLGAPQTYNLSNICATPSDPYTFMSNCADGTNMAAPALDVWYRVTLTASQLVVTLEAGMNVPSLGLWRDVGAGCGGLQPAGCTTGAAGYAQETFGPLLPGVYYLQISGGDLGDQCDFLLTLQNNNSCADCLVGQNLTATPQPVDGVYAPGTLVTFCYTVTDYNDAAAVNWLHGIVPVFGNGWDISTLSPQPAPATCGTGQGVGTWAWYNFPVTGQNGSSAQTTSIGPGFFFESNFGCPGGACNPLTPGDNWGDNLTIDGCSLVFCWRINTLPAGAACIDEASLNVYVETYSDSETGSWTQAGCTNDPDIDFFATLNCCDVNGSVTNNGPLCIGETLQLGVNVTTPGTTITYDWSGPDGFTSTLAAPSLTNIQLNQGGYYSVVVTVDGCISIPLFTFVQILPQPDASASNSGPVCPGQNITLSASSTSPGVSGYIWSGPGGFSSTQQNPVVNNISIATAGTYSVIVTDANGCSSAPATTTVNLANVPNATAGNTGPVCAGGNITLTASTTTPGAATYQWSGPGGFSSTQQNPVLNGVTAAQSGVYTVVITVGGCNSNPTTTNITINPQPDITASNNGPVCLGGTLNLTASTTAAGAATYQWSGPAGFSSTQQNPVINGVTAATAGVYSVTVTVNGCSSTAGTTTVALGSPPNASASNSGPVCLGGNITLNASSTTPGAATYQWSGPGGFSSTQQNPVINGVTAATAGDYTVTITIGGCASAPATTTVVVNPLPDATASNNGPVCLGASVGLTANTTTPGIATYQWSGPNGFSSTAANPLIPAVGAAQLGDYTVVITVNGCPSAPATTTVAELAPPVATAGNNGPGCLGGNVTLNASTTTPGAATYQWSGPGGFSSTQQNPVLNGLTATNAGVYTVTVTVSGCASAPASTTVVVNNPPTGNAASNSPVCVGNALNLTASTPATGTNITYAWSGPGGFTSTNQNPTIAAAALANGGTYTVVVTVDGCAGSPVTTDVVITPQPLATATNNGPACLGDFITLSASTTATGTTSYQWSGPNGFTSTQQNPLVAGATVANAGVYTVTVTVNGCASAPASTTLVVNAQPTATATNTGACVGGSLTLNGATTATGATIAYAWTGPNGFTSTQQNPTINPATAANGGIYSLVVTVDGCASNAVATTVVVNAAPAATVVAVAPAVCNTTAAGSTLDFNTLITGGDSSGFWTDVSGSGASGSFPILNFNGVTPGTYTFNYTTNSAIPPCNESVYPVSVVVEDCACPSVAIAAPAPLCNNSGVLDLLTIQLTTEPGTWSITSAPPGPNPATLSGTVFNGVNANPGAYQVTFTLTTPPPAGCAASATQTLVVSSAVSAGANNVATVCNNNPASLDLNTLLLGNTAFGTWSLAPFSPAPNPGAFNPATGIFFTNAQPAGTYTFQYTITTTAPCTNSTATIAVTVNAQPVANLIAPAPVCNTASAGSTLNLNSLLPPGTSAGFWTDGSGNTVANTNLNFDGFAPGNYTFTYNTNTGVAPCTNISPGITVTVEDCACPSVALNPASPICNTAGSTLNLTTLQVTTQPGTWTINSVPPGAANPATLTGAVFNASGATAGVYQLLFTLTTPPPAGCAASATQNITVVAAPNAGTGSNTTVCNSQTTAVILNDLLTGSAGGGTWTLTSGTADAGAFNAAAGTFNPNAHTPTALTFTYTLTGTPPCANATTSVTVTIITAPNAGADGAADVCNTQTTPIALADIITGEDAGGTWSLTSGVAAPGAFNAALGSFNPDGHPAATLVFTYTIPAAGSCAASTSTAVVNVFDGLNAGTAANLQVCNNQVALVNLFSQLSGEDAGGIWTVTGGAPDSGAFDAASGSFAPNNHTPGAYLFTYSFAASGSCPASSATVQVDVSAQNSATVVPNANICNLTADGSVLNFTTLITSGNTGGVWAETTTSGVSLTNPTAVDFNGIAAGSYIFTYTLTATAPCADAVYNVTVLVQDCSCPSVAFNAPPDLCNDLGTLDLSTLLVTTQPGTWSITSSPAGSNPAFLVGSTFAAFGADAGVYTISYTLSTPPPPGCLPSASANLLVADAPNGGVASDLQVCNDAAGVVNLSSLLTGADAGGIWSVTLGSPDAGAFNAAAGTFNATGHTPGDYTFAYTLTATAPCADVVSTVTVSVQAAPDAGIGGSLGLCNNATAILNLNSLLGGTPDAGGVWSVSVGSTDAGAFNAAAGTFNPNGHSPGVFTFTYTITGAAPCVTDSEDITITLNNALNAGADTAIDVCTDAATPINLLAQLATADAGGTWTLAAASPNTPTGGAFNAATGTFNPVGQNTGAYIFTYTQPAVGDCGAASASVTVNVTNALSATLLPGDNVCNLAADGSVLDFTTFITSGSTSGAWADTNGAGVDLTNLSSVDFNGIAAGAYTFTYTLAGGGACASVSYTVAVVVEDCSCPSVATVLPTGTLCNAAASLDLTTLQLTTEPGTWSITATPPGANPATLTGATFNGTGADAGSYTVTFALTTPPPAGCPAQSSQTIQLAAAVNAGTGSATAVCNDDAASSPVNLSALLLGADAGGVWSVASGSPNAGAFDATAGAFGTLLHTPGSFGFTYTLAGTGTGACATATALVTVNVSAALTAVVTPTATICNLSADGSVLNLTALVTSGSAAGTWADTDASGVSLANPAAVDFNGITSGIYTFTYSLNAADPCADNAYTVTVTVNDCSCPSVATSAPAPLCNDAGTLNLTTLQVTTQPGTWSITGVPVGSNPATLAGAVIDVAGADAGNYELTFTLNTPPPVGCPDVSVQTLTVQNAPNAGTGGAQTVCNGGAAGINLFDLVSGADLAGNWSVAAGSPANPQGAAFDAVAGTFNPDAQTPGVYVFAYTLTAAAPCANSAATVTITVEDCNCITPPAPQIVVGDITLCEGTVIEAMFEVTTAPATVVNWYDAPAGGNLLASGLTYTATAAGTYYAEAANNPDDGCVSSRVAFTLAVTPLPVAAIIAPITVCAGEPASIALSGAPDANTLYAWNFGAAGTPTGAGAHLATWNTPGSQTVTLTATLGICEATATTTVLVTGITAEAVATPSPAPEGATINLTATGATTTGSNLTYNWQTTAGTLSCTDCANPTAVLTGNSVYTVTLTDVNGCTAVATVNVAMTVQENKVLIPNAFSPNGDATNDIFRLTGINIADFELIVFDRWGVEMFSLASTNLAQGWDGTYKGKEQEVGVYVYYAVVNFTNGQQQILKGNVTLVR